MSKKKIIILTTIISCLIFICFFAISIIINIDNNKVRDGEMYIIIEQIDNKGNKRIVDYILFNEETNYERKIDSLINEGKSNFVHINNSKCYITDSECPNHTCEDYVIKLTKNIFSSNNDITCLPNGLYISLSNSIN